VSAARRNRAAASSLPGYRAPIAETEAMLKWAFIFLIIAIVAGILGFTDVEFVSATIARVLFGIFLVGFLLIVLFGFILGSWLAPR
jgi:uncharacterized membrane protein YtjA (UPF0391 family)